MITFRKQMDDHSLQIERHGEFIGFLQWHTGRSPNSDIVVELWPIKGEGNASLTMSEVVQVTTEWEKIKKNDYRA